MKPLQKRFSLNRAASKSLSSPSEQVLTRGYRRGRFSGRQCLKPFSGSAWPAYRQPGLADAFDDQGLSSLREDDGRPRRHSTRTLFPGWLRRRIFISREWKTSRAHPRRSLKEIVELSF